MHFEYAFDDIGNRRNMKAGGDNTGANLRSAGYVVNALNQYGNREVPGYVNTPGTASNNATVTLWGDNGSYGTTSRKGEYFSFFDVFSGISSMGCGAYLSAQAV
ncbi:MAG: hypothetical protein BWX48_00006 [Verrucomicrobia bacterium ADurb.Bin006]|jgi:hypothetical protein|nr:hypothetical protein [Verrucomicrobiota bacterium]OQC68503.1 MAG: hypothetical protein BWX48_00006 [Verrucomicrobia bacterium ADurb.Bin006]HQK02584.1 hypothetical protein [Verrucomicrobiota bacterium]